MKLADLLPKGLLNDDQDAIALLEADHDKVLAMFEHFEDIKDSRACSTPRYAARWTTRTS